MTVVSWLLCLFLGHRYLSYRADGTGLYTGMYRCRRCHRCIDIEEYLYR